VRLSRGRLMRHIWAFGACTAWLVVPFGWMLNMQMSSGIGGSHLAIAGFTLGIAGILACNWALSTLVYRMLKAGDRVGKLKEERPSK
jgi:hypothetical protein